MGDNLGVHAPDGQFLSTALGRSARESSGDGASSNRANRAFRRSRSGLGRFRAQGDLAGRIVLADPDLVAGKLIARGQAHGLAVVGVVELGGCDDGRRLSAGVAL